MRRTSTVGREANGGDQWVAPKLVEESDLTQKSYEAILRAAEGSQWEALSKSGKERREKAWFLLGFCNRISANIPPVFR